MAKNEQRADDKAFTEDGSLMSKVPHLKPDRVIRAIKRAGFEIKEGTRHAIVIRDDQIVTMVPRGSKFLKKGTVSGIIRDIGMTLEEFKTYL